MHITNIYQTLCTKYFNFLPNLIPKTQLGTIIPILQMEKKKNQGTEKWSNLPTITKLVNERMVPGVCLIQ